MSASNGNRGKYKAPASGKPSTQYVDTKKAPMSFGASPQGTVKTGPDDIGASRPMPKMS